MVNRPERLLTVHALLFFNGRRFTKLEIDIDHINKDSRSRLRAEDVINIVFESLNGSLEEPCAVKSYGKWACSYFIRWPVVNGKKHKLVFCTCTDEPSTIGVITLHRVRR